MLAMFRRDPKSKLKNEEAQYINSTVSESGTLQHKKNQLDTVFVVEFYVQVAT